MPKLVKLHFTETIGGKIVAGEVFDGMTWSQDIYFLSDRWPTYDEANGHAHSTMQGRLKFADFEVADAVAVRALAAIAKGGNVAATFPTNAGRIVVKDDQDGTPIIFTLTMHRCSGGACPLA